MFKRFIVLLFLLFETVYSFNKVQYKPYDWKYITTTHFKIYYYGSDSSKLISKTAFFLERAFGNLSNRLNYYPKNRIKVVLYNSPNDFSQTNIAQGYIGEGTGGFTEFLKKRVVIPFDGNYSNLRHVVHHELFHAFVYSIYQDNQGQISTIKALSNLPLWLHEGMAEYFSQEWSEDVDLYVRDAVVSGLFNRYNINMINGYLMYKSGESFCEYISKEYKELALVNLVKELKKSSFKVAFKKVFSKEFEDVYNDWIAFISKKYWKDVDNYSLKIDGKPITEHFKDLTYININPSFSTNDSLIAYFTDRYDYMNLVIKNIKNNKIIDRVGSMVSQNFESFHPFYSSISWSSDNNYLYYSGLSYGKDVIFKYSLRDKKVVKEYIFKGLNSIRSPHISPLDNFMVFEGKKENREDVYIYFFESKEIINLGNDISYDAYPTVGEDGSHVYFVKEYVDSISDFWNYNIQYQLISYNLIDKSYKILYKSKSMIAWPKQKNGKLYFISYEGISPNIVGIDLEKPSKINYITSYFTGVTNYSIGTKSIALNYLNKFGYDISIVTLDSLKRREFTKNRVELSNNNFKLKYVTKNVLSSNKKKKNLKLDTLVTKFKEQRKSFLGISENLDKIDTNRVFVDLPIDSNYKSSEYSVEMSLDMASVGLGYNSFTGYSAQSYILLSDVLSNHQLAIYMNGSNIDINNLSLGLFYAYLPKKWDLMLNFYTFPYFHDNYVYDENLGYYYYDNSIKDQNFELSGVVKYPFSTFNSLYFSLNINGVSRKYYNYNYSTLEYDEDNSKSLETDFYYSINSGYVFDNRLWGNFGPINGHLTAIMPSINTNLDNSFFAQLNATRRDYFRIFRAYNFANSFNIGVSKPLNKKENSKFYYLGGMDMDLLNYSTIDGNQSIDEMLNLSFVTPLRGYDLYSIKSKNYILNNLEFRFPFIQNITFYWPLKFSFNYIGGAIFLDQAYVWNSRDEIPIFGKNFDTIIKSNYFYGYGVGLRFNLGYYVLKADWALQSDDYSFFKKKRFYLTLNGEF